MVRRTFADVPVVHRLRENDGVVLPVSSGRLQDPGQHQFALSQEKMPILNIPLCWTLDGETNLAGASRIFFVVDLEFSMVVRVNPAEIRELLLCRSTSRPT